MGKIKAEVRYIDYKIYDHEGFNIHAKISKKGVTLKHKNKMYPNEFQFIKSDPELIKKFSKALDVVYKLSRE